MALEKYEYPATGAVTNSFLPTRNPSYAEVSETFDEGVVPEQSSGSQEYRYEEGIQIRFHHRTYAKMANSEKTSYENFRNAVGGQKFKFTDASGGVHTVSFASFTRDFTPSTGDRWSWGIVMREEL